MSKAILVMDMPESCDKCPLMFRHEEERCCMPEGRNSFTTKPNWCPLKPMLEKKEIPAFDHSIKAKSDNAFDVGAYMYNRGMLFGWNYCIEDLIGK